ncbi:MAG: isochorismatase family protein [Actinobacteria bacterium]|uniref:Unannotated protein n=1 Tax=freshwater metagenome TaxID=449393 RepID=A0A6J6TLM5_9ZZZZ|nr:isochorismatase family protein [Actinomycetota bacterium]MSY48913.1 isochorismatase family protein [Actinomycetota bacterium]
MPVSALDPVSAIVVIDLQHGIVASPKVHPANEVIAHVAALVALYRIHNLPVVLVNVDAAPKGRTEKPSGLDALPQGWSDLIPELNQQPTDHLITKKQWGAFTNTDLDEYLKSKGVTQVVVVGMSTSIGVESTARHARELGYSVTLVTDAMTDTNLEAHNNSIEIIFPRLGETCTVSELTALLEE